MGRTGHSGESRDVLCFLMQHSLLFAISNGRIRNIQSESICNMEWKTTDTTKEKRNNHARIHFTFNCCPDVLKTQKGQEFLKTKQDKNDFLIGNLLPDTTKIKARSHFRDPKYHDRM